MSSSRGRPIERKTASAGYYNTVALEAEARRAGLLAGTHLNGDAFSDECKREAIAMVRKQFAPLDLVIYSLASPRRVDPRDGSVHNSTLKPIGAAYSSKQRRSGFGENDRGSRWARDPARKRLPTR